MRNTVIFTLHESGIHSECEIKEANGNNENRHPEITTGKHVSGLRENRYLVIVRINNVVTSLIELPKDQTSRRCVLNTLTCIINTSKGNRAQSVTNRSIFGDNTMRLRL